jgi:hypothetical protein
MPAPIIVMSSTDGRFGDALPAAAARRDGDCVGSVGAAGGAVEPAGAGGRSPVLGAPVADAGAAAESLLADVAADDIVAGVTADDVDVLAGVAADDIVAGVTADDVDVLAGVAADDIVAGVTAGDVDGLAGVAADDVGVNAGRGTAGVDGRAGGGTDGRDARVPGAGVGTAGFDGRVGMTAVGAGDALAPGGFTAAMPSDVMRGASDAPALVPSATGAGVFERPPSVCEERAMLAGGRNPCCGTIVISGVPAAGNPGDDVEAAGASDGISRSSARSRSSSSGGSTDGRVPLHPSRTSPLRRARSLV